MYTELLLRKGRLRREVEMSEFIKHRLLSNILDEFDISTSPYQYMEFLEIDKNDHSVGSIDLLPSVATLSSNANGFFEIATQIQFSSDLGPLLNFLHFMQSLKKRPIHFDCIKDSLYQKNELAHSYPEIQVEISDMEAVFVLFINYQFKTYSY
jgi:hypothetical protein